MRIVKNKIIPFGSFLAVNLFGVIFTKRDLSDWQIHHEAIHTQQMKELLYIPYYILYVLEFLIRLPLNKFGWKKAYRAISFEAEAYTYQHWKDYLRIRQRFTWVKFLKHKNNDF